MYESWIWCHTSPMLCLGCSRGEPGPILGCLNGGGAVWILNALATTTRRRGETETVGPWQWHGGPKPSTMTRMRTW